MKAVTYNVNGEECGSVELNSDMFCAKINKDLMHRAVVMRLANRRNPIAHVKTRAEVVATRKKMFRQKGTGNARRGNKTAPLLRGGGVAHGPRNTVTYSKQMPRKERRRALFSSLSAKASNKEIFALEGINFSEPKTKDFVKILKKLPEAKKILFVLPASDFVFEKSSANIPGVKHILVNYLNPYDVLHAEKICFLTESLPKLEEVFLSDSK